MVFDLHNDIATALPEKDRSEILRGYDECGYKAVFAIWVTGLSDSDRGKDGLHKYRSGRAAGIEDLGSVLSQDRECVLRELSPVYASLTWNGRNGLAGGVGAELPLMRAGRRAIRIMANAGVALDTAHLSDTSFYDAFDEAVKTGCRILCSHTASRALSDHPRCITDEQAKLIADAGGVIGVAAVPAFLDAKLSYGENCRREDYIKHVLHFCEVAGADHVCIGSDLYGAEYYPEGLTDIYDLLSLDGDLAAAGLTAEETAAVMHINAEKFFRTESYI